VREFILDILKNIAKDSGVEKIIIGFTEGKKIFLSILYFFLKQMN
jgi:hypothetical protein